MEFAVAVDTEEGADVYSHTLDYNLRTGYNPNTPEALDTPYTSNAYMLPMPFAKPTYSIEVVIPAPIFQHLPQSSKVATLRITVKGIFGNRRLDVRSVGLVPTMATSPPSHPSTSRVRESTTTTSTLLPHQNSSRSPSTASPATLEARGSSRSSPTVTSTYQNRTTSTRASVSTSPVFSQNMTFPAHNIQQRSTAAFVKLDGLMISILVSTALTANS